MSEFNPEALAPPQKPIGKIAILTPRYEIAESINRDVQRLGLAWEIYAFFPGQAIMGHRFRKLYVGLMDEKAGLNMRYPRYQQWFEDCVRCRLLPGSEIVDSSKFRNQYSTLLQHIIETDTERSL
jgi:hypothetical protein